MSKLIFFGLLATLPLAAQNYTISTFAGGGPNGVNATVLPVGDIGGVVNDSSGNCYFSSITLNRIFRVDSTGTLYVVAGYGLSGSSGDGGPATAAGLSAPTYLALDKNGYLYISDAGNNRVRRVLLSTGIITSFAGTGTATYGGDGSSAISAQLNTPKGIAADNAGNIYIADSANNRVRVVNSGGIINTFAGTGTPGYNQDNISANSAEVNAPSGLAFDTVNSLLYIGDEMNYRIRRVSGGIISTVVNQSGMANFSGDGNPAASAQINRPQGLALDASENLFIADTYNYRIRKVAVSGGVVGNITTAAGSSQLPPPVGNGGPATSARLNYPTGVSVDGSGKLYIADRLDDMVRTVPSPYGASTNISLLAGNGAAIFPVTFFGDNGPATNAVLSNPFGSAVSADGNTLLVADQNDNIVRSVNLTTGIITTVAGNGTPGISGNGGAAISAQLNLPYGVAFDSSNNIYIADFGNNEIRKVDHTTGNIGIYAGSPTGVSGYAPPGDGVAAASALLSGPVGIAFDAANNLYVSDYGNSCVRRIAGDTQVITTVIGNCTKAGSTGDGLSPTSTTARLDFPESVAVNSTGTVIYVADTGNSKIRWVNNNLLNTFAGTGTPGFLDGVPANQSELQFPSGVSLDSLGNLFIADVSNNRVRKVQAGNANNTISTVAGGSTRGFGGDGGVATNAELASPYGVTVNPVTGGVYVDDYGNNRVRLLSVQCTYQISPLSNLSVGASGGSFAIAVTTNPAIDCPWTAVVPGGVSWITITSGSSGNGSGTVNYSVLANSGGSVLSTALTVAGSSFTVTEAPGACTYGVNPTSTTANTAGGTGTVTVTTGTGCLWTAVSNASWLTITSGSSGSGSGTVGYSATANTGSGRVGTLTIAGQTTSISQPSSSLQLITVSPCRVIDTRAASGPFGGPYISGNTSRSIAVPSSGCGVPSSAVAYSVNITVVPRAGALGYLTVWPTGQSQPVVSTLNSPSGLVLANAAIVPAGSSGAISAFATNDTDLIVDINGYFVPPALNTLQFYPLTPCRVLDTRSSSGTFGGPSIFSGTSRSFPVASSSCGAPSGVAAYSFNVTVVPQNQLGYLTAWPSGQTQPVVSTLNSTDGSVLANAAIVPAGSGGAVSFFASNTTDLIVDINGYFAAPQSGGLNFYSATPCRLVDTRGPNGALAGPSISGGTTRSFPLSSGPCGIPGSPTAQAYSLNMTVVPQGALGYLTTWSTGGTQPVVSTLNAPKGQIAANAAIVPSTGSINVFVTNTTDVIVDTDGYFGP